MRKAQKEKKYDLEDRTQAFAKNCRLLVRNIKKDLANIEDGKQLVRSSGSVAANYIEANESLSKKDFSHRIKICRKEAKESQMWLEMLYIQKDIYDVERKRLVAESIELRKIFGAILEKTK